jgi:hypothetical protein
VQGQSHPGERDPSAISARAATTWCLPLPPQSGPRIHEASSFIVVSIDTINIYAETNLEMKAKALAHCEIIAFSRHKRWREHIGLMTFLRSGARFALLQYAPSQARRHIFPDNT